MPAPSRTAEIRREEARREGAGELYFARVESFKTDVDPASIGFDAAVEFAPDWRKVGRGKHHDLPGRALGNSALSVRDAGIRQQPPPGAGRGYFYQWIPRCVWLELLCKHIPDRNEHLVRYVGWYSNRAGVPGGGYATARAMAAFYRMLAAGGKLNGVRLLSPRLVQYVTRNFTGDRVDGYMGMPRHRGLGPHLRGATTDTIRGLGSLASPRTFGHGGVGSSYYRRLAQPAVSGSPCHRRS